MDSTQAEFVGRLVNAQARIEAFVRTLVMDVDVARDIVQQTNLVLCEKAGEYDEKREFGPWACGVAYFEVLSHRKKHARERGKLLFDDDQLHRIAAIASEGLADVDDRLRALDSCMERLPEKYRALLRERYEGGHKPEEIGRRVGRPAGSIRQTLFRARLILLDCIQARLAPGGHHG